MQRKPVKISKAIRLDSKYIPVIFDSDKKNAALGVAERPYGFQYSVLNPIVFLLSS